MIKKEDKEGALQVICDTLMICLASKYIFCSHPLFFEQTSFTAHWPAQLTYPKSNIADGQQLNLLSARIHKDVSFVWFTRHSALNLCV